MTRIFKILIPKIRDFILVTLIAYTGVIYASPAPAPAQVSLNQIMTSIGKTMVEIYPLIVAKRELTHKEIQSVENALSRLSYLFATAKPFIDEKSDGYQISYEFVSEYLKVVKSVLMSDQIDYARSHLYALGEICTSCHTQDSTLRTLFSGTTREHFDDDYAYAEFNYMTRNYRDAVKYYEIFLASPARKTELEIIQPLQRIITIYTQVNNQPAEGIGHLRKFQNLKDHTSETKAQLESWIRGLEELNMISSQGNRPVRFDQLSHYVTEYLAQSEDKITETPSNVEQEVQRVWLRGQLYHYLNRNPDANEIPMLLYWLSVADRSIAYNFYFSMTDLYLKQCVLKYPKHPFAPRCFREYREYVNYIYTRNGEPIPEGIQNELRELVLKLSGNKKN